MNNGELRVVGIGGTLRKGSTSLGALRAAGDTGARTELLDLRQLNLPFHEPGRLLEEYGPEVKRFVEAVRGADALLISTGGYHGTLAGVTKNALDFLQFLSEDERPYLDGGVIGLISTAGGDMAAVHAADAMVHAAHALRGTVAPLIVAIPKAWSYADGGEITGENHGARLEKLGRLVVETAARFKAAEEEPRELRTVA